MELLKCVAASEARCLLVNSAWLLKKDLVTALEVLCELLQLPSISGVPKVDLADFFIGLQ